MLSQDYLVPKSKENNGSHLAGVPGKASNLVGL
jgi:hypothetical protein